MHDALFRLRLPDGAHRLALGVPGRDPDRLLPAACTLDGLLGSTPEYFWDTVLSSPVTPVPGDARVVAPIESQPVWAAGVTYAPSRDARKSESLRHAAAYEAVFHAVRPELFYKAGPEQVRGQGERISIRSDSSWNVPEPEVALALTASMEVAAITIGNDVSSRSIEGSNPLYLPQAKVYDGACALGPCLVRPVGASDLEISLRIDRAGEVVFEASTHAGNMVRTFQELGSWLGRALTFPSGVILLTGTGIIPPADVSLHAGDRVRIGISGIGALGNDVREIDCGESPADEQSRGHG